MRPSERVITILTGLIVTIFFVGSSVVAVLYSAGTFDDVYEIQARFPNAGQGLIKDSDVKVRGVNIGEVKEVDLDDRGRAFVTLRIQGEEKIPEDARAVVRPKTLFGEKFVDIETTPRSEEQGPFLDDGDEIADTVGSFELEQILVGAQELLESVRPQDVGVIIDTLAETGKGEADRIRRQLQNFAEVSDVFARHDADTRRFLDDFERLIGAFDRASDDVVGLSQELNSALPDLNARADRLDDFLDDAADVSRHLAEIFERNRPTLEKMLTEGGKTLEVLHDNLDHIPDLVVGLRNFGKVLAQAGLFRGNFYTLPDGTRLGTIKLVSDADTLIALACSLADAPFCPTTPASTSANGTDADGDGHGSAPLSVPSSSQRPVTRGLDAVVDVVGQIVGAADTGILTETPVLP